jgi:uncharacterized protein YqhQ
MQPRAGGQAVFEGVMMRVADRWAVAVRTPDGRVEVMDAPIQPRLPRFRTVPLFRGMLSLIEALPLGLRAMKWSIATAAPAPKGKVHAKWVERLLTITIVGAVVAAFCIGPGVLAMVVSGDSAVVFNVVEGVARLAFLVGYLVALGRLPEVRRLFEYHGAEHKVVGAYEAGAALTPASVARFSTRHIRCGTSFLLLVAVVSTAVHVAMGRPGAVLLLVSRLALIPVVAAIAAEIQQVAANHACNPVVRTLLRPGLALQGLTTREPSEAQLEVAIAALEAALPAVPVDRRVLVAA